MAREFLLRGVSEEELQPPPKPEAPKTPRGKWENFWYHYKWPFWGAMFFAVVLGVLGYQLLTKNPADYQVILVTGTSVWDDDVTLLEETLAQYGQDLDGDGEVEVQIQNCYLSNPGSQQYMVNQQAIQSRIFAADVMLFVWEPKQYEDFMKNVAESSGADYSFMQKLDIQSADLVADGCLWNWENHPCREDERLDKIPAKLYFGVRSVNGTAANQTEMQKQCLELLEAFAANQKTAQ